jgi:hypothetical protein
VVVEVSSIAKASAAMAHQASQNPNDIGHAALAYTIVRNVFAHSWAISRRLIPRRSLVAWSG